MIKKKYQALSDEELLVEYDIQKKMMEDCGFMSKWGSQRGEVEMCFVESEMIRRWLR